MRGRLDGASSAETIEGVPLRVILGGQVEAFALGALRPTVYLGEAAVPHSLKAARLHRGQLILSLTDCPDRDCAEQYRNQLIQIKAEAAAPLPPGSYYHHQLLGLQVVSDEGEALGQVVDILETGANDVYVVATPNGELLLPAISTVVLNIDLPAKQITAHLIDGLR